MSLFRNWKNLLFIMLLHVTFVHGSKFEQHVAVSMLLGKVKEGACVVIQNGRVVLVQYGIARELPEVLKVIQQ